VASTMTGSHFADLGKRLKAFAWLGPAPCMLLT
jgi:hypothetical protein